MTNNLDIRIQDILETATCDLTGRDTECIAVSLRGDPPCLIATTKLVEWIRFEKKRLQRKNGEFSKPLSEPKSAAN